MFRRALYIHNVTVLGAGGSLGHSLRIKDSQIEAIDQPPHKDDTVVDGEGGLLIPGLINAHDHLDLNTFPRLKYRERYAHALEWIEDIEARFETDPALTGPRGQPLADRLLVGACKNLLSGVTTVCHHNPFFRPLRRNYPIRVVADYGFCHSLYRGGDVAESYRQTKPETPWIIHLAEGVDQVAAAEFAGLDGLGALQANTVLVHGVGLRAVDRQELGGRGSGLIWCPGSNDFLFGQTACVHELAEAGQLALGSDSRLSGEFDLLAELRVAARSGQISPRAIFRAVTTGAARVLRLRSGGRGQLIVGGNADLVLLPLPIPDDPFARLLDVTRAELELVLLEGKPLLAAPRLQSVFEATRTKAAAVQLDQVEKLMPAKLVARLRNSVVGEPGLRL
jgi:cytosine/adenosine deaminase-related metal-dependent hydrolase